MFLPFAAAFRPLEASDCPIALQLEDGRRELLLSADERQLALADRERLGEDLRKFYVALTRARYATWLGLAPLKGLAASAPGYLFGGGEEIGAAELAARFATLADARASIVVGEAPAASSVPYAPRDGRAAPAWRACRNGRCASIGGSPAIRRCAGLARSSPGSAGDRPRGHLP